MIEKVRRSYFVHLVILVITIVALFQTLWMYFLIDDNALIYKLQHFDQNIGYWGRGFFGTGPYRHIIDQYVPFYPLFKTNPTPYYLVGIILYYLASLSVYYFVRSLTKDKRMALVSAVIFATGYVGATTLFGMMNSWQTSRGLMMAFLTFYLYLRFMRSKRGLGRRAWYFSSIALFYLSLDTVFIRAPGLVFAIMIFDFLFWPVKFRRNSLITYVFRVAPFAYIHYLIYLSSLAYAKSFGALGLYQQIVTEGKWNLALIPIEDVGNLFIPDRISQLAGEVNGLNGSLLAGLVMIGLTGWVYLRNVRKNNLLSRYLLFAFGWMVANFVVFYLREPGHTLETTHRYFSYSLFGLSFYWAVLFYLFSQGKRFKFKRFWGLTIVVVGVYLFLGLTYQRDFNQRRSFPARSFFKAFDNYLPNIPKGAVLYFDIENSTEVKSEFDSFFGGMFSEGANLAIYTEEIDYMKDFLFTYEFDEVLGALANGEATIDDCYFFYYSKGGLEDMTGLVRGLLEKEAVFELELSDLSSSSEFDVDGLFKTKTKVEKENGFFYGMGPVIKLVPVEKIYSIVPSKLTIEMRVGPIVPGLPYREREAKELQISGGERSEIMSYLDSQRQYWEEVGASSASFWMEQEAGMAVDGRLDTVWRGHRGFWDEISRGRSDAREYFMVDLGRVKEVGRVRWISSQQPLVPTVYEIMTSVDKVNWEMAAGVERYKKLAEETVVTDDFSPRMARYVKMEIIKTYGNDGPELKEFEVVESRYVDLNEKKIDLVRKWPFSGVASLKEYGKAVDYIRRNAKMEFYWMADSDVNQDPDNYVEMPMVVDGRFHKYEIDLPAAGMYWNSFLVKGLNFPCEVVIRRVQIKYGGLSAEKTFADDDFVEEELDKLDASGDGFGATFTTDSVTFNGGDFGNLFF